MSFGLRTYLDGGVSQIDETTKTLQVLKELIVSSPGSLVYPGLNPANIHILSRSMTDHIRVWTTYDGTQFTFSSDQAVTARIIVFIAE